MSMERLAKAKFCMALEAIVRSSSKFTLCPESRDWGGGEGGKKCIREINLEARLWLRPK